MRKKISNMIAPLQYNVSAEWITRSVPEWRKG